MKYWGGWNIYEYDASGRMTTHTDYTATGERHHITHFKYAGDLKIKEWKETAYTGTRMYLRKFKYDNNQRLIQVLEDDKIVEENAYTGDRLTEKRVCYWGINPGFSPCNGNYLYKYEY